MYVQLEIDRHLRCLTGTLAFLFYRIEIAATPDEARGMTDGMARLKQRIAERGTLPRCMLRLALELLVPLEAIVRRLIVALALDVLAPDLPRKLCLDWKGLSDAHEKQASPPPGADVAPETPSETASTPAEIRIPPFMLLDPQRRHEWLHSLGEPSSDKPFWATDPNRPIQWPFEERSDQSLLLRVAALMQALDDMPAQARRFIRWMTIRANGGRSRVQILRTWDPPGRPPRNLPESKRLIRHHILEDANLLAWDALNRRPAPS